MVRHGSRRAPMIGCMSGAVRRVITACCSCASKMCMQQLIKRFSWIGLLALGLQGAWAFSLGGPIGNNPNPSGGAGIQGDAWQTAVIGYGLPGDINAPKNLGEEYRRNVPTNYYACDANFLDYFGSNGVAAVDGAFAILNG